MTRQPIGASLYPLMGIRQYLDSIGYRSRRGLDQHS